MMVRMPTTLATLNIEVSDLRRSVAFYTDALELVENSERSHPPTFAYLESNGCALTMTTPVSGTRPDASRTIEFGFETDSLERSKARLERAGIAGAREVDMGWGRAIEFVDPDGYRLVLYELRHR